MAYHNHRTHHADHLPSGRHGLALHSGRNGLALHSGRNGLALHSPALDAVGNVMGISVTLVKCAQIAVVGCHVVATMKAARRMQGQKSYITTART